MIIPEGFAQITYRFEGSGLPRGAACVFGVSNDTDLSALAVATAARAAANTGLMTNLSAGVSLTEVLAKLGPVDTGPSAVVGGAIPGGVASAGGMQPATAYLITKNTDLGGRRGKGRLYLPGVDESVVSPTGVVSAGQITALQAEISEWRTNLITSNIPMVLLHGPPTAWQLVNGQPRRVPVGGNFNDVPNAVTSLVLDGTVATQRRRLRG